METPGSVLSVRWAHHGRFLATGSDDQVIMIWGLDPYVEPFFSDTKIKNANQCWGAVMEVVDFGVLTKLMSKTGRL